jgi:putative hemolysin
MFDYEIKIAQTKEEKEKAFRLRFEVFRKELNTSPQSPIGEEIESDIYDKFCDHLIVIDKTNDSVIGTYRLLLKSRLEPEIGFYSERLFDISNIKNLDKEILELSRSCVHKDYRESLVINLLWSGIAKYMTDYGTNYLFGSVRLNTVSPREISEIFCLIKEKFYATEDFRVYPLKNNALDNLDENLIIRDHKSVFLKLPPLVKGYLRLGVKVCGLPALNPDFGSIVLFILLDINKIPPSYKRHFFNFKI